MSTEPDDTTIERFARQLIISCKGDPDMIVQPGTPQVYGTPSGDVFAVTPGAGVPLWRHYKSTAKQLIEMAVTMLQEAPANPTEPTLAEELAALDINTPMKCDLQANQTKVA